MQGHTTRLWKWYWVIAVLGIFLTGCNSGADAELSVSPGTDLEPGEAFTLNASKSTYDDIRWFWNNQPIGECNGKSKCQQSLLFVGTHRYRIRVKVNPGPGGSLLAPPKTEDSTSVIITIATATAATPPPPPPSATTTPSPPPPPTVDVSSNLVLHYPLDSNAKDFSDSGLHGLATGGVRYGSDRFSQSRSAATFDGVDDTILRNSFDTSSYTNLTVSAWVNTSSVSGERFVAGATGLRLLMSRFTVGKGLGVFDNNSANNVAGEETSTSLNDGNWHHLAATSDGSEVKLYVNGKLEQTYSEVLTTGVANLNVGSGAGANFWDGQIDDFRVYDSVLTQEQIEALFEASSSQTLNSGTVSGGTVQGSTLSLSGAVTTVAGSGAGGFLNATGIVAQFNNPRGLTTDASNLYVADETNNLIRKVVLGTYVVSSVAGGASGGGGCNGNDATCIDGVGSAAQFNGPRDVTTDGTHLYVVDSSNHRIRKIDLSTLQVTTLAGGALGGGGCNGNDGSCIDGVGSAAQFNTPHGITTDGTNLYVSDTLNHRIRKVEISSGTVTTLSGDGIAGFNDGNSSSAQFDSPNGITTDGTSLYVADLNNHRIRRVVISTGAVATLAGNGTGSTFDGTGTSAQFNGPIAVTTDGSNLYVVEFNRVRQLVISSGEVTTLAGDGIAGTTDEYGTTARFNDPEGIVSDGTHLFIGDNTNHRIRKIE